MLPRELVMSVFDWLTIDELEIATGDAVLKKIIEETYTRHGLAYRTLRKTGCVSCGVRDSVIMYPLGFAADGSCRIRCRDCNMQLQKE